MKKIILAAFLLNSICSYGNIKYIRFDNIGHPGDYSHQVDFLRQNVGYFDHWVHEWSYPVKKDTLVRNLLTCLEVFSHLDGNNAEVNLLEGDIAHYLYNLDMQEYSDKAEAFYQKAIGLAPGDYRGYWFLATHYTLANLQSQSVEYFQKARQLLPAETPAAFWEEYAGAMYYANMPAHSLFAVDQAKKILGKPAEFEDRLTEALRRQLSPASADSAYKMSDLWIAKIGDQATFISKPLGVKLKLDTSWQVQLNDYDQRQAMALMAPPQATGKDGKKIGFSIVLLVKAPVADEKLEDYVKMLMGKYDEARAWPISPAYPKMISYELKNKELYPGWGGAHVHIIGIERESPLYPGLKLEEAIELPHPEPGKTNYVKPVSQKGRFRGRIFYVLILDTCEEIHQESLEVFKKTFGQQLTID